jgi:hypothetical protein
MAKKKVYRFLTIARAERRAENAGSPVAISALATVLARRSGRSSVLPYPPLERRDSTMLAWICHWTVFQCENGRLFVVNF